MKIRTGAKTRRIRASQANSTELFRLNRSITPNGETLSKLNIRKKGAQNCENPSRHQQKWKSWTQRIDLCRKKSRYPQGWWTDWFFRQYSHRKDNAYVWLAVNEILEKAIDVHKGIHPNHLRHQADNPGWRPSWVSQFWQIQRQELLCNARPKSMRQPSSNENRFITINTRSCFFCCSWRCQQTIHTSKPASFILSPPATMMHRADFILKGKPLICDKKPDDKSWKTDE